MRQLYHTAGHRTFDLTECKVHRVTEKDGKTRFLVSWPSKWVKLPPMEMDTCSAGKVTLCGFDVTEWEEAELELIK